MRPLLLALCLLTLTAHAQPPCVTDCLLDTTIWVSADSAYQVQMRSYCITAPDTFVNVILWVDQHPGLMHRGQTVEYCSGHAIRSWFDWLGKVNAEKLKINP